MRRFVWKLKRAVSAVLYETSALRDIEGAVRGGVSANLERFYLLIRFFLLRLYVCNYSM